MKISKGHAGYIKRRKLQMFLRTLLEFGIVAALLLLGYLQTGSRKNLLTIVAVVGCLPASKAAVGWITLLPYKSIMEQKAKEIQEKAELLTQAYDLVLTSREKMMPLDCIVISGRTLCGYTPNRKLDLTYTAEYIKEMYTKNGEEKIAVKLFHEYKPFLARAEGLNNMAAVEKKDTAAYEERLRELLLTVSM